MQSTPCFTGLDCSQDMGSAWPFLPHVLRCPLKVFDPFSAVSFYWSVAVVLLLFFGCAPRHTDVCSPGRDQTQTPCPCSGSAVSSPLHHLESLSSSVLRITALVILYTFLPLDTQFPFFNCISFFTNNNNKKWRASLCIKLWTLAGFLRIRNAESRRMNIFKAPDI